MLVGSLLVMCCFTGPVLEVKATRIFARALAGGRQLLIYDMAFAAAEDVAMVLPIPVVPGSGDDAVRFVDLSSSPKLFDTLDAPFGPMRGAPGGGFGGTTPYRAPSLVVHRVGVFEASFVPKRADFGRLDPRFRLDEEVITALGERAGYGFVVVKLGASSEITQVHPIGFSYPTREPKRLFFPTVHVHDGRVHPTVEFDHALYTTDAARPAGFEAFGVRGGNDLPPRADVDDREPLWNRGSVMWNSAAITGPIRSKDGIEVIDGGATLFRRELSGARINDDAWVDIGSPPTPRDVVAEITRAVERGRTPPVLESALREVRNRRIGFLASLRESFFSSAPLPDVDVVHIEAPERSVRSGAVFRVFARRASLRGPRDDAGVPSVLCGLVAGMPYDTIRPLDSREAIAGWVLAGGEATKDELAWLRRSAR